MSLDLKDTCIATQNALIQVLQEQMTDLQLQLKMKNTQLTEATEDSKQVRKELTESLIPVITKGNREVIIIGCLLDMYPYLQYSYSVLKDHKKVFETFYAPVQSGKTRAALNFAYLCIVMGYNVGVYHNEQITTCIST